ncbi:hypothetical protein ARMSODRAFT_983420 [Armillaria solidipes]|uniref:Uncharacterized protein n=1 Tax=Armillaria solidipes TaxID=1076256 RepID=A0A2H3AYV9_9AGAR|nr:hypothetical protein ARMSODRAFT_983420 [Armillaria solidipes]
MCRVYIYVVMLQLIEYIKSRFGRIIKFKLFPATVNYDIYAAGEHLLGSKSSRPPLCIRPTESSTDWKMGNMRAAINGTRDGVGSGIDQNNTTIELPESPEVILDQNQNHISQDVGPVLEVRSDLPPNRPSGMESPSETSTVSEILVNSVTPIKVQPTESKYLAAPPQVTLSAATEIGRIESLVKVPS